MIPFSRRDLLATALAPAGLALAAATAPGSSAPTTDAPRSADVHQQILDLAARQQEQRRARFRAVASKADLEALQALSPYRTEHINRFGHYVINRARVTNPTVDRRPAGVATCEPPKPGA